MGNIGFNFQDSSLLCKNVDDVEDSASAKDEVVTTINSYSLDGGVVFEGCVKDMSTNI